MNYLESPPSNGFKLLLVEDDRTIVEGLEYYLEQEGFLLIFTRFYRGRNSSKDSVGIGLSMSKSIIKNQSGDISVESQVNKGSTFFVKLYKSVI